MSVSATMTISFLGPFKYGSEGLRKSQGTNVDRWAGEWGRGLVKKE